MGSRTATWLDFPRLIGLHVLLLLLSSCVGRADKGGDAFEEELCENYYSGCIDCFCCPPFGQFDCGGCYSGCNPPPELLSCSACCAGRVCEPYDGWTDPLAPDGAVDTHDGDPLADVASDSDGEEVDWGHGVGMPCEEAADCTDIESGALCFISLGDYTDGYCSYPCSPEDGCGLNEICLEIPEGYYCHLCCETDADCRRESYHCQGGEDGYCMSGVEL